MNIDIKDYPGDKKWLGMDNSPGEWPAFFHGTSTVRRGYKNDNVNPLKNIVNEGF